MHDAYNPRQQRGRGAATTSSNHRSGLSSLATSSSGMPQTMLSRFSLMAGSGGNVASDEALGRSFHYDGRLWLKASASTHVKELWRECEKRLKVWDSNTFCSNDESRAVNEEVGVTYDISLRIHFCPLCRMLSPSTPGPRFSRTPWCRSTWCPESSPRRPWQPGRRSRHPQRTLTP